MEMDLAKGERQERSANTLVPKLQIAMEVLVLLVVGSGFGVLWAIGRWDMSTAAEIVLLCACAAWRTRALMRLVSPEPVHRMAEEL